MTDTTNPFAVETLVFADDGTVPKDNPFVGRAKYKPEIFALGIRNARWRSGAKPGHAASRKISVCGRMAKAPAANATP